MYPFERHFDEQDDRPATLAEADREWANGVGADSPDQAWILSDRDVWYRNPAYSGPDVPHPDADEYAYDNHLGDDEDPAEVRGGRS